MIDPLIQTMRYLRDLLGYDEQLIKKGRINEQSANSKIGYIAVDALAPAQPTTRSEKYDGVAEVMTYCQTHRLPITIDFYGQPAYENATKLTVLTSSHIAQWLQKKYNIRVGSPSGITDVKALTGQQYVNRMQIELILHYTQCVEVDVLRIEKAPFEVITNEQ